MIVIPIIRYQRRPSYRYFSSLLVIEVKLGASVLISQQEFAHIRYFVDKTKLAVIEELYGEFRKPLLALEIAIAQGSRREALEKTRKLYRDMFGLEGL